MSSSAAAAAADGIDASLYEHSAVHCAIIARDHTALHRILASLPRLSPVSEVLTESASLAEEEKVDAISSVIDRRDVPGRETPLHLAVRLGDSVSAEILMCAGADWSLQNERGWSALQEAICSREEQLARAIVRHYQPLAWAKWCRRLPRLVATMRRMRDFYMEITFHFESSVIPFISRVAPSDTFRIWKRGANLRADLTLAGFDGLRIQRADQSVIFLGGGSEDGKILPGALLMVSHKDKEVINTLENAAAPATEDEISQEVTSMSQTSIFRPGIDVTQSVLLPQLTWRRQERTEMVGPWKAKVYDMHNVMVSVRSRSVPGAMTDEELLSSNGQETESESYEDILTEEEKKQLEAALKMESPEIMDEYLPDGYVVHRHSCYEPREIPIDHTSSCSNSESRNDKKGWFSWGKRGHKEEPKKMVPPRGSLCIDEKVSDLLGDSPSRCQDNQGRHSVEATGREVDHRKAQERELKKSGPGLEYVYKRKEGSKEREYKKGLRPVLWLSSNFPLQTNEFLPLLDILATKVKAIRRLRELLTTKFPAGTFPVKVAIPVVPTIRVLATFTKFRELQPSDEFSTPPSSPGNQSPATTHHSSSWLQWIKAPYRQNQSITSAPSNPVDTEDPFLIPPDYIWTSPELKKKKAQENKSKPKKDRTHDNEPLRR